MLLLLAILSLGIVSAASYLRPSNAASSGKYFDYVVTILMENNDLPSVLSQGNFQASLANQYTLSTGYSAVSHPSEPNYSALVSGHITPNSDDGICCGQDSGPNLVDRLESGGLTWKAFAEDMSSGDCSGGGIDADHFPFIYFSDVTSNPARCANLLGATAGSDSELVAALNAANGWPNYVWLTPNTRNDAHDTSIATGDSYLSGVVPQILGSTLFKSQRAALFVVYDEGNDVSCSSGGSDCVYASWSGPVAKNGFSSTNAYSHYSYLHTIEDNWGLQTLTSNDAGAPVMSEFFTSAGPISLSTSFTVSPSPAQANQPVTFTASTFGGTAPYTDSWSFGDGSSGTGSSTSHSYSGTGTFQVTLTTQDSANPAKSVSSTKSIVVNQAPLPGTLSITFNNAPTSPVAGQTVTFGADITGGTPPYGVGWDFGDGGISVGTSTSHTFSSSGSFNVTVAVTDSGSPARSSITSRFVSVGSAGQPSGLSVDFSFQPSSPSVGVTVSFTSSVSGGNGPYTYSWDFGDSSGPDSNGNPSHGYSNSGTFSVVLTVDDSAGATVTSSQNVMVSAGSSSSGGSGSGSGSSNGQYCSALSPGQAGDLEPIVSVDYVNPASSASFSTNAVFDSGAAYSLAPSSLASSLGLVMSDGTPLSLTTVSGGTIQATVFHLTLSFGGSLQVVNVPVAFTDSTNQFLIGRVGFLNQVSVTFDSTAQTICLDAGSPASSGASGGGSGDNGGQCSTADDDDPDGDADDCGQSSASDTGGSGSEYFLGITTTTVGGAMSGLPMILTMIPVVALGGMVFIGMVRVPRRVFGSRSSRRR